ncbi:MAG TPA: hypothetical protein VL588_13160 [Bdellovibrionota bacterium]|nr:hypothetical protein [Bdellovibrionota bacterium]
MNSRFLAVILLLSPVAHADSLPGLPAGVEAKLARISQLQKDAAKALSDRMGAGGAPFTRAEWESLLGTGKAETTLTASEIQAIQKFHRGLIRFSKAQAAKASDIDLENLRKEPQSVQNFCRELPKGGMLHIHPWGTLHRPAVVKILEQVNPLIDLGKLKASLYGAGQPGSFFPGELDFLTPYGQLIKYSDLKAADQRKVQDLFFLPAGSQDFKRFMGTFTFVSALVFANHSVDPEPFMWDAFLHDAGGLGVSYVEVTTNVRNQAPWVQGLEDWEQRLETQHGVVIRLLAAFNRMMEPEKNRTFARQLVALPESPILVGANLLADETDHPMLEKGQTIFGTLLAARAKGQTDLRFAPHAGELGDARNPRDAMIMGAERLGHGVKLGADVVSLELARRQGLGVEANLESNLRLRAVSSMSKHPFLDYLRLGLKVSLSTDDEGMFNTDIHDECVHAVSETDISYAELKKLSYNSLDSSFADDGTKARLKDKLDRDFARFEDHWESE